MAATRKPASQLIGNRSVQIVLVTAPPKLAEKLARQLLKERLIACANLMPRATSLYWWQGKLQRDAEILLIVKTQRRLLKTLHRRVRELHTYEVPEFLVLTPSEADRLYAQWVSVEVSAG
jgi:periplasmic divalent cation tolerance protein